MYDIRFSEIKQFKKETRKIRVAIRYLSERIDVLTAQAESVTNRLSHAPRKGGKLKDDTYARLMEEKKKLQAKKDEFDKKQSEIEALRASVEYTLLDCGDPLVVAAIGYKYLDGMSWTQAAAKIGGVSSDSLRMLVKRFFKKR